MITDETLTAYLLGELPANEIDAVDAALASDTTLRDRLEQLRTLTDQLTTALAAELANEPLADAQNNAAPPLQIEPRSRRWPLYAAAAAVVIVGAGAMTAMLLPSPPSGVVAMDVRPATPATQPTEGKTAMTRPSGEPSTPFRLNDTIGSEYADLGRKLKGEFEHVPGQQAASYKRADVQDLVTHVPDFSEAPEFNLTSSARASAGGGAAGGGGGQGLFSGTTASSASERQEVLEKNFRTQRVESFIDGRELNDAELSQLVGKQEGVSDSAPALNNGIADATFGAATRQGGNQRRSSVEKESDDLDLALNDTTGKSEVSERSREYVAEELKAAQAQPGQQKQAETGKSEASAVVRVDPSAGPASLDRIHLPPANDEQRAEDLRRQQEQFNREAYARITDNPFNRVGDEPLSTFSVDVDTASYSNVRRFLTGGQLPPADAVRIEELINYFTYSYDRPKYEKGGRPFNADVEVAAAPWNPAHRLVRVGVAGAVMEASQVPPANLVFLLDVSGSMSDANKLPLVKRSMKKLVEKMAETDQHRQTAFEAWLDNLPPEQRRFRAKFDQSQISIVVYAGASGLALQPTDVREAQTIFNAIDTLQPGGSTNGAAGIQLAYDLAQKQFIKDGVNRVILCTDGDFNVGITNEGSLTRLIEDKAKTGVFLSVLGFGTGNLQDSRMEQLADKGNGNFAYIDSDKEAEKALVQQSTSTLVTIAKDVKLQVEFNPAKVGAYRLIGYENRVLATQDFNDDTKDAGEIGAGHTVTALYEIIPVGVEAVEIAAKIDALNGEKEKLQAALAQIKNLNVSHADIDRRLAQIDAELKQMATLPEARPAVDRLKYQAKPEMVAAAGNTNELLTVKIRHKLPDTEISTLDEFPVSDSDKGYAEASGDFKHAAAVAGFGMLLRGSPYDGQLNWAMEVQMARQAAGDDPLRLEFVQLVERAAQLAPRR